MTDRINPIPWIWILERETYGCFEPDCQNPARHVLYVNTPGAGAGSSYCDEHLPHARLATTWAERALTGQGVDGIQHAGAHPDDARLRSLVGATRTEDLAAAVEKRIQDLLEANTRKVNAYRRLAEDLEANTEIATSLLADIPFVKLGKVVHEIREWQAQTFPNTNGVRGPITHMAKEMAEITADMEHLEAILAAGNFIQEDIEAAKDKLSEEIDDMVFLAIQAKTRLSRRLEDGLTAKLTKNKARKWGKADKDGVVEHIREETNG